MAAGGGGAGLGERGKREGEKEWIK
jgi:hypothetical protein